MVMMMPRRRDDCWGLDGVVLMVILSRVWNQCTRQRAVARTFCTLKRFPEEPLGAPQNLCSAMHNMRIIVTSVSDGRLG